MTPDTRQVELGRLLVQRRSELAHRFIERRAFAKATGLNERLLLDIETATEPARRIRPKTKADLEMAYQLRRGAIDDFCDGKTDRLEPAPSFQVPVSVDGDAPGPEGSVLDNLSDEDLRDLGEAFAEAFRVIRARNRRRAAG